MRLRITKEFHFEASHCLNNYDGLCKNIHGHSYKLFITLRGKPCEDRNSSSYGMVMDFSLLKKIVNNEIIEAFDHSIIIEHHSKYISAIKNIDTKQIVVPFQPTCENLVLYIVERIKPHIPQGTELYSVVLYETASSHAEWNIEDSQ